MIRIFIYLLSISVHEMAHVYTANYLGDDTLKSKGRLTLNPFKHINFFKTFFTSLTFYFIFKEEFYFFFPKKLIINNDKIKNSKRKFFLILLSGPLVSFVLCALFLLFYTFLSSVQHINDVLFWGFFINLELLVISFLPFSPFDARLIIERFFKKEKTLESRVFFLVLKMSIVISVIFIIKEKKKIFSILLFLQKILKDKIFINS